MKAIKRPIATLTVLFSLMLLSGCAALNSDFQCPLKNGTQCKRVDQINQMVNRGQLGHDSNLNNKDNNLYKNTEANSYNNFSQPYPMKIKPGNPLRYHETVMRIWVAPYEDTKGNYHQASFIDTVVKQGHWIGNPVTAKGIE